MRKRTIFIMLFLAVTTLLSISTFCNDAEARAGGRRSIGNKGSRSFSPSASPSYQQRQSMPPQQQRPMAQPYQAPQQSGGFLRSMMGGIAGGLIGGMLFRSLGMAGPGGAGGGGFGIFEFILLGGIAYFIYRFIKSRREAAAPLPAGGTAQFEAYQPQQSSAAYDHQQSDSDAGIAHIRQMDASFDEQRFCDAVMDTFFKIQSAWMHKDLAPAAVMMTAEMRQVFQSDLDLLIREKRTNRLENIAVRKVEIVDAWQESGQDFITTLIYANLLDYTTDDISGQVVDGSKTEPVKFEEYWTFCRPVGPNPWQLSAIDQK